MISSSIAVSLPSSLWWPPSVLVGSSSASRRWVARKSTFIPGRIASWPISVAWWLLPTPVGPQMSQFS